MNRPAISVVMAGHNCDRYVEAALSSILRQSIRDIEVIFVDDGSTDETLRKVTEIAALDRRIEIVSSPGNRGLAASLNDGISRARAPWIARMDADDIAYPHRLERQLAWAESQLADVCGGWTLNLGGSSLRTRRYPEHDDEIKLTLCLRTAFSHPAVILRTEIAQRFPYDSALRRGQDYDLWTRLAAAGVRMTNIQARVLRYRVHPGQASVNYAEEQALNRHRSHLNYVEQMIATPDAAAIMGKFASPLAHPTIEDAEALLPIIAEVQWASPRAKLAIFALALRYVQPASMDVYRMAKRLQSVVGAGFNSEMVSLLAQSALRLSTSSLPYRLIKRLV